MIELKIAKARKEIEDSYIEVKNSIDEFENSPTKYNRDKINNKIQGLRTNISIFKKYINELYLKM